MVVWEQYSEILGVSSILKCGYVTSIEKCVWVCVSSIVKWWYVSSMLKCKV